MERARIEPATSACKAADPFIGFGLLIVLPGRAFLFSLAFNPLVIQERLLPQLVGIALLDGGQWAGRRPVSTWQPIEEGAQALHARSVAATACPGSLWISATPDPRPTDLAGFGPATTRDRARRRGSALR